ncbi:MAG: response regulator [Mariniphaga sp.]|nr:response regulator [Mariniphaga sp.]
MSLKIFAILNLFIWGLIVSPNLLFAGNNDLVFHRLTLDDGLSNSDINQIFQDKQGFIWMCTDDGLDFFDGYTFKTYKHNATDSSSISSNTVLSVAEDKDGQMWVGTNSGLNIFDRARQTFKKYQHNPKNANSISNNRITKLCFDKDYHLWVGTDQGLNLYNKEKDNFVRYGVSEDLILNIKGNSITALTFDDNGNIWTSDYYQGISKLDPKTGSIKHFPIKTDSDFLTNIVLSIFRNPNGNLWLGLINGELIDFNPVTEKCTSYFSGKSNSLNDMGISCMIQANSSLWMLQGKNLVRFDTLNKSFITYSNDPLNLQSFPKGSPITISMTNDGTIWVGIEGVVYFNPKAEKFSGYYHAIPKESTAIRQNFVKAMISDKNDNLFIGTYGDGLIKINLHNFEYKRISNNPLFVQAVISCFHYTPDGKIWIGTSNGLMLFDPGTNQVIKSYKHKEGEINSLFHDFVNAIEVDRNNNLWISTQESLDFLNQQTNSFIHFTRDDLKGLSHYKVTSIKEDSIGNIWVGTYRGLNKFDAKTHAITQYLPSIKDQNSISDPYINGDGIYTDNSGLVLICTKNGLNKYNPESDSFTTYNKSDGLLSDNVGQAITDNNGNWWITSVFGISKYDPLKKTISNYTSRDGLNINVESLYKDSKGYIYIGGKHENFYRFHPDSIKDNPTIPPVFITELLLFSKPVGIYPNDKNSPLTQDIISTDEIVLNYKQADFALEFTALNFHLPEKNRFAYKMEGYNENWITTDAKRRIAGYNNLNQGEYVFLVKAANNDGVWNETPTRLKIKILPPPWKTKWAFLIYAIIILISLYYVREIMMYQLHLKNSLQLEHTERERENAFNQLKTKFFINISHEFRTPLMLISGPIIKLLSSTRENLSRENELKYFSLIARNTQRLTQLTNQLLDFRKIETGTMVIELFNGDLVNFTKNIADRFLQYAVSKKITIQFYSSEKAFQGWFDPDKLEKIISNIISNALKFTPEGGFIAVDMVFNQKKERNMLVRITDTGIGIAPEHLNSIFERFYQINNSTTSSYGGTGIGLALAKDMVILCSGDITVESTTGKGSTFIIELPTEKDQFGSYKIITELKKNDLEIESITDADLELKTIQKPSISDNENKPTVLVIEDNKDLIFYIGDILSATCKIESSENGISGVEKAFQIIPDIIICDIMMPGKDGFEVTSILKSDNRTSHIPIIMLTALNSDENKLKGLEIGASDYITKPFVPEILLLKIKNSIEYRHKLKAYFMNSVDESLGKSFSSKDIQPKEIIVNSIDEKILKQALEIVEENIADSEFSVEKFASALGMESSTLYKKFMALLGMAPGEFIREIRMKRAAQIMSCNKISISEIAYMVGFENPQYFTKVFRKYYDTSPTNYISNLKKEEKEEEN